MQQNQGNQSEVARLRDQMDKEREAMRLALNGAAIVAKHEFITARMENIGIAHEQIKSIIGDDEAAKILIACFSGIDPKETPAQPG